MQQRVELEIFKNLIDSIVKFEKYEEFATHKLKHTILYTILLVFISSIIISIVLTIKSFSVVQLISSEFKEKIYSVEYNDGILSINNNNFVQINYDQFINIIIDTSIDSNQNNLQEYIKDINNKNMIIFLKNECIITDFISDENNKYNYKEMQDKGLEINRLFLDILNTKKIELIGISLIFFILFEFFILIIYGIDFFIYAVFFALIGKLTSIILKVPLKFKENYNISTHALTLSTILQTIYISINFLTGFNIKYFYIMYMGVTDIYIITAILIIKADMIKRKLEVDKIIEEQKKIKKEYDEWNNNLKDKEAQDKRDLYKNE